MNEFSPNRPEQSLADEIHRRVAEKAAILLDDFGQHYATAAVHEAGSLFEQFDSRPLSDDEVFEYAATTTPETFIQAFGIALDFPVTAEFWNTHKPAPLPHETRWHAHAPMIEPVELFRHVDVINLETILIQSTHTLAQLEENHYKSEACYDAVVRAESMYAPLCEIIGLDGLAMAMRSKASVIRLRNSGRGQFVDEAERLLMTYDGNSQNGTPLSRHFVEEILSEVVGESDHDFVIGNNAKHGITVGEGLCQIEGNPAVLRTLWRLKTVGSLADKLAREAAEESELKDDKKESSAPVDRSTSPLDVTGITLVAEDDAELIRTYVQMVHGELSGQAITPVAAPSRECAFHIRGSKAFVAKIRSELEHQFPDRQELFEYALDTHGFHVAKVTGYYEDNEGRVPFEIQALTAEGRRDARIGKSAHIFYKLSRQLGDRYTPAEQEIQSLARINHRKEYLGIDGLTPASEQRLEIRLQQLVDTTYSLAA